MAEIALHTVNQENALDLVADIEVVIDETSIEGLAPLPTPPGVLERLQKLEGERREAYSQMHRMVADIGTLKTGHERSVRELELLQSDALYRLALLAEFRNGGGSAKVLRIGVMSALLAQALGCDEAFCDRLQAAAPLLDVGEIALPDSLFYAPVLSDIERELMRSHCRLGASLLANSLSQEIALAAEVALSHHEHFNGRGYPNRLAGNDIPLSGRIVAVVDCFDALTMKRPFRAAHSPASAATQIMAGSGGQFDPAVIEVFRQIHDKLIEVRSQLDESVLAAENRTWLNTPPEPGFWRKFL